MKKIKEKPVIKETVEVKKVCPDCNGRGLKDEKTLCKTCAGSGKI